MSSQRLQKILAQAGIASRRAAERLITEGRVRVNGRVVSELGARANPQRDRVEVDGRRLVAQRLVYFLLHKPRGVVTTLDDPEGRKTVKDLLHEVNERVFPVGRLDFQTSGALLLTNDGQLAQALLHPKRAVPKTYNAKLQGKLDEARLNLLRSGVTLDDGQRTGPAEVKILRTDDKATSVEITISEGKNRQIHRMGEAVDRTVLRLTRIAFAGLTLDALRPGQMRSLNALEVAELKQKYMHSSPKRRKPAAPVYGAFESPGAGADLDTDEAPAAPAFWGRGAASPDAETEPQPARSKAVRGAAREQRSPRGERAIRGGRVTRGARSDRNARSDRGFGTKRGTHTEASTPTKRGTHTEATKSTRGRPSKLAKKRARPPKRKATR